MGDATQAPAMSAADEMGDLVYPAESDALDTAPLLDGGADN
jgi:hypothetical protein